jgi:phage gp45-like
MKRDLLKPQVVEGVPERIAKQQHVQAQYYDRGTKDLSDLSKGDVIRMEPISGKKCWKKAIVVEKTGRRSYKVQAEDGTVYHRNRRQLRVTRERMEIETNSYFESETESEIDEDVEPEHDSEHEKVGRAETEEQEEETGVRHSRDGDTFTRSGQQVKRPEYLRDYVC